jgi:hypothetical protein
VSNIYEMSRVQKAGVTFVALTCIVLFINELFHLHRYGHFAPFGLHADVTMTQRNDVLGVDGDAKIYRARLTNYGIFPATVVLCAERIAGAPEIEVNYLVERWDNQSGSWRGVPEWDFSGYRLFCAPVFEVSEEHLMNWRLWPGQSLPIGEGIPAQLGGFHAGDVGKFTIFLNADGSKANAISTAILHVDQEVKKRHVSGPD